MTVESVLRKLEGLGDAKVKARNIKNGSGENLFGVKMGDVRKVAKECPKDLAFLKELWITGNLEARLVVTLLINAEDLSVEELEGMVREVKFGWLADWLNGNVVKAHPAKEELRVKWMGAEDGMLRRSGWSLMTERVCKNPEGLDMSEILDGIDQEIGEAPEEAQWTMNYCLAEIGIGYPELRERAVGIGEKYGLYRDYPVSKGCVSPFAPIWIREMVSRSAR